MKFPNVNCRLVPLILTAAAAATLAVKVERPVTQWSCADFLSVDDQLKPKGGYRTAAFAKEGQPEAAVIDIKGIEDGDPANHPRMQRGAAGLVLSAVEGRMEEVEA